jgi:hypothetical protein
MWASELNNQSFEGIFDWNQGTSTLILTILGISSILSLGSRGHFIYYLIVQAPKNRPVNDLFLYDQVCHSSSELYPDHESGCPICLFHQNQLRVFCEHFWVNKSLSMMWQTLEGYISNDIYILYPIQKLQKRIYSYHFFERDMLRDMIS